jgi:hypothetical protein
MKRGLDQYVVKPSCFDVKKIKCPLLFFHRNQDKLAWN